VGDGHPSGNGTRLRLARQARGFSQQQVADMAGVSRQAISAFESGVSDPSLRVAIALSRALSLTVEELFGTDDTVVPVAVRQVAPLGAEGPVTGAGRDRGRQTRTVRPIQPSRPTLVAAGCDPALPLLEAPLGRLDPPVAFTWWPCSSREALALAAEGLVHVAGSHLRGPGTEYNIGPAAEMLPRGGEVIGFCAWREGLVLRPDLADGICGVSDLAGRGLRLANREPGSEARASRRYRDDSSQPPHKPRRTSSWAGRLTISRAFRFQW